MAELNAEGLERLVQQFGNPLYKFCRKLALNKADADDLYQETFLKATEQYVKIEQSHNQKGYLISIAVYLWKSKHRKTARRLKLAPEADMEDVSSQADSYCLENDILSRELHARVNGTVHSLDDRFRIPLYLYYTVEMSMEEISSALKIPAGTVKSRLYKARKLIQKRLEAIGIESISG